MRRHDFLVWSLCGIVRCIYFYQPLVWWLRRQLRLDQDYLADQAAVEATTATSAASTGGAATREDYAQFLTSSVLAARPVALGLGIGGGKSELYRRVVILVDSTARLEQRAPRAWTWATFSAAAAVMIALSLVRPDTRAAQPEGGNPAAAIAQQSPSSPAAPPVDREQLRYGGKSFAQWSDTLRSGRPEARAKRD